VSKYWMLLKMQHTSGAALPGLGAPQSGNLTR
jgi:hypothetical protein